MSQDDAGVVERLCAKYNHRPDALIEILHDVQAEQDHISDDAARVIADRLNITRAEVHGVRSFYSDFKTAAPEGRTLKLCRAEACQAVGSETLAADLAKRGIDAGLGDQQITALTKVLRT